jgi:anaerobic selenocysteine-containing dehydrogenase
MTAKPTTVHRPAPALSNSEVSIVRVGCPAHNCGGRCLIIAHLENGRITRLETDDRPDSLAAPQLRACPRGRAYLRRQYHPDRLLHPLKRTSARGTSHFARISWDEALDTLAAQFERVKAAYGNAALFVPYGTGSYNQLNGAHTARRLLNLSTIPTRGPRSTPPRPPSGARSSPATSARTGSTAATS